MANNPSGNQPFNTQAHAESSRAAENPAPTGTHKFLRFDDPYTRQRYLHLSNRPVNTINSINWMQIKSIDPDNRLVSLLPPESPWRRFFDILEPSYDELVYEFWSTFHFWPHRDLVEPSIYFRLGGQHINCSLTEFAVWLGIYTEEEVKSPIFTHALTQCPSNIQDYWFMHSTSGVWCKNNNSTTFRDPRYRYIHRVLANTIRGRTSNRHRVSSTDLYHLYSIFESRPCNIALSLALYFEHYRTHHPKNLMGGAYITRLANSLGILGKPDTPTLSTAKFPGVVDVDSIMLTPVPVLPSAQPSQPEVNPPTTLDTTTQNLQQWLTQLPQQSSYQSDLQFQQQPIHIPTNLSQSQTHGFFQPQPLLPLTSEQENLWQQILDEGIPFSDLLASVEPVSQPWQQFPQQSNQQGQQQVPSFGAGPSTMPSVPLHQHQTEVDNASIARQNRKLTRQVKLQKQRIERLEEELRQMAKFVSYPLVLSPSYLPNSESESESD